VTRRLGEGEARRDGTFALRCKDKACLVSTAKKRLQYYKKSITMNFTTLAKKRYSCRKYTQEIPSEELLNKVLNSARIAPSAKNLQPWKFVVVNEEGMLKQVKACYGRSWIEEAPIVIAVCGDHGSAWTREDDGKVHTDIDVSIAIDHLTLAATDNGLGTCWICRFDSKNVAELLEVPDQWEVIALIPIGFPANESDQERHERLRKPLDEIVSYNKF
jgi:nitroreductase